MKKIYFGINGQFGDIIIQEPTLRKIMKLNPDAEIYMGAYKKYFEILDVYKNYHPNIKQFIKWERYTPRFEKNGDGFWPSENDKKIIDKIGFDKMYDVAPVHKEHDWVTKRHIVQECGNMYGIDVDEIKVNLKKPEGIIKENKSVAISLFPSDWKTNGIKSLRPEIVNSIVYFLKQKGYTIYHLSGPGEPNVKDTIKIEGSYIESVYKLLQTEFLITCDTGMAWVSSAYNHPTLGLWGWGTNHYAGTGKNWMPENPNAEYLESFRANDINIYLILDKIRGMIK
tara:strand:- start:1439 stop:2287 length:849 start_codon:yes stop_codon:yes gene_type:complete